MGAPPDGRFPRLGLVASPRPHGLQSGENFRVITVNCWQVCWAHERERGQIWPGCFTVGWEPGFFSVSSLLIRYQVGSPSSSESCVDSSHCTGLSGPSRGVPSPGESRGSGAAGQGLLLRARAQGPQAGAPPESRGSGATGQGLLQGTRAQGPQAGAPPDSRGSGAAGRGSSREPACDTGWVLPGHRAAGGALPQYLPCWWEGSAGVLPK